MASGTTLQRKLAKFRRAPKRFLRDSQSPVLRALANFVPEDAGRAPKRRWKELVGLGEPRAVIEASGLFDERYYARTYPDLQKRRRDLLGHYMRHGELEGRAPNAYFDTRYYVRNARIALSDSPLVHYITVGEARGIPPHPRFDPSVYRERYPDVEESGYGPLEHFLKIGVAEGRRGVAASAQTTGAAHLEHDVRTVAVTILVPVYNGYAHVRRCIESVLREATLPDVQLLIIDDASPDPRVRTLLDGYAHCPGVTLLRNESNLGFTRTVNRGLTACAGRDVVLLNSDTIVGPRFLESLVSVAYGARSVATATALSDNSGAFSTPKSGANPTAELLPAHEAARLSARVAPTDAHFVPTGNGFCMYMRREAIDAVGLLDDTHFPRGYGEENDWCMRAGNAGFRHAIALRAYVHHVNAVSFGSEAKLRLRDEARAMLDRLHPDYGAQVVRAFTDDSALGEQRRAFEDELASLRNGVAPTPRPRVLFVVSTLSGGTPLTNQDLMRGVSHLYEPLLLVSSCRELELFEVNNGRLECVEFHSLSEPIGIAPHTSVDYDAVVASWLVRHGIELLHVRHIAWHSTGLVPTARRLGIPVVFSLHDFYCVDPSVNLTNGHDRWSETGVTSPHIIAPLWVRRDPAGLQQIQKSDPEAFLALWKRRMNAMLEQADAFVTTSPFARDVFQKNLPVLRERAADFHVIPHGRDFARFLAPVPPPRRREPLRVLLPGNISESKGLHTIMEILRLDHAGDVEFHLLGTAKEPLLSDPRLRNHGAYSRDDFADLVNKIKPHVGLIISIWPETFCHTLTECWAAGVPVIGCDLGAVGERIGEVGAGWQVDPFDAAGIYRLMERIRRGDEDWSAKVDALTRWRQTTARWDVASMARCYLDVYHGLLERRRHLQPKQDRPALGLRPRVALVVRGHYPRSMPTSHVRIATQVGQASGVIDYEWFDAAELVRTGARHFDGVVVCRNAADPETLSELARQCKASATPIVFDLDDDLMNVPAAKDPGGVYPPFAPAMRELLAVASMTTVSTEPLLELYQARTDNAVLVPNRLDPRHWSVAVDPTVEIPEALREPRTGPRILYMGSPTHQEDLDMVLPAFERLRAEFGATLYIIGVIRGGDAPEGVVPLKPPNARYDQFIGWFRAVAPHFDVAIAPLTDASFNRAKSALKFMEYAAAGVPVVASRVIPYDGMVRDGVDGLLADADADAWVDAITSLVQEPDLRRQLSEAAKLRAREEFICQSCVFDELPWQAWREQLRAADPGRREAAQ